MTVFKRLKNLVIGRSKNPQDIRIFQNISLIAFFAWIGLGADGISSSCYGPQEAFLALGGHTYLSVFVALGSVFTIFIISASYSQIVELFPSGGGGYLVASKLLSPTVGMVSGCALLIDYVLTIAVSIASGTDALFSLFPMQFHNFRIAFAMLVVLLMVLLNLRGVKDSILPLVPIFLIFIFTHVFIIIYALYHHFPDFSGVASSAIGEANKTASSIGIFGVIFLILRAYTMGAGTYTGIEAVSNGIPVLREPKVQTAKRTIRYMAISLAFIVLGLMLAYLFYNVKPEPGKTLNAVLLERATAHWGQNAGYLFILITLISEAAILFVAAQTGFLDSPRVLGNMALDRWFPVKFSTLSDRLVIQNGILISGGLALALMIISRGSVRFLVILYSINVFITFVLSQLGMVRHWWLFRSKVKDWYKKITINGIGLILTSFILLSMLTLKFFEGGWITVLITGTLILLALAIRRHYYQTMQLLHRLNTLVAAVESNDQAAFFAGPRDVKTEPRFDSANKTAVIFVNGFNGMGLHTLFGVIRLFGGIFKNFIFVQIGIVDAGNFKGVQEVEHLDETVKNDVARYVKFMAKEGYYAEGITSIGVDVIEQAVETAPKILERFPNAIFFGGQLVFPKESFMSRFLHNYTVFALQKNLYYLNIPFFLLPIRV